MFSVQKVAVSGQKYYKQSTESAKASFYKTWIAEVKQIKTSLGFTASCLAILAMLVQHWTTPRLPCGVTGQCYVWPAMAEVAEGKALLRNFRLRQQLKLLPGRSQPAGTVSLKRLELLLNHESFGYESEQIVEPPVTCEISKRKEALQQQLEELKVTKEAEMSQMRNAELAAQSLQQEMAKMVDEHEILTRQRCELSARQKELADETLRLQAVLTDLAEDEAQSVQKDENETVQSSEQIAKMAERLKLHHLHLQRLLAEQKLLQQQLGTSGNQAMGW